MIIGDLVIISDDKIIDKSGLGTPRVLTVIKLYNEKAQKQIDND